MHSFRDRCSNGRGVPRLADWGVEGGKHDGGCHAGHDAARFCTLYQLPSHLYLT
jgi:hypothetical protein